MIEIGGEKTMNKKEKEKILSKYVVDNDYNNVLSTNTRKQELVLPYWFTSINDDKEAKYTD